jgi:hypothetical protein
MYSSVRKRRPAMAKRRMGKLKVAKNTKKKDKKSKSPETVDKCDYCFTPLGRLYGRMVGSASIAAGNGLAIADIRNRWHFFCDDECRANHHDHIASGDK